MSSDTVKIAHKHQLVKEAYEMYFKVRDSLVHSKILVGCHTQNTTVSLSPHLEFSSIIIMDQLIKWHGHWVESPQIFRSPCFKAFRRLA
jgi:hypothetical protein